MALTIWQHRNKLHSTLKALQKGEVVVGFIGGSITDERPGHNWPESVIAHLVDTFPGVRFIVENAGIGATGSDYGALRVKRDLIDRHCDLVFVEYAVNDLEFPTDLRNRTREGLLRQLLQTGATDVVLVYTYSQDMYEAMIAERVPASIAEFETLADYYGLGSVWMGLFALNQVKRGMMKWEEWLPDGLHPTHRGSFAYGSSVITFLENELQGDTAQDGEEKAVGSLPEPLYPNSWEHVEKLPFSTVELDGPWSIRRSVRTTWADQILETNAVGASLSFSFQGNGLVLVFDFGRNSSEFRYQLDGGEWIEYNRPRPDWVGDSGWLKIERLADYLDDGEHHVKLEVIHGNRPECKGTQFRLTDIGVIKYS